MVGVLHGAAASRFMALVSRPAPTCQGGQVRPGERQEACIWPSGPSSYSQAGGILPKSHCRAVGMWAVGCQTLPQCRQQGAARGTPCSRHQLPLCCETKGMGSGWDPGPRRGSAGSLVLPFERPQGAAPPRSGVSAPWERSWAGCVGLERGVEGLEQAKPPGRGRSSGAGVWGRGCCHFAALFLVCAVLRGV